MTHIWLARLSNEVKLENVDVHDLSNEEEEDEDHVSSPNFWPGNNVEDPLSPGLQNNK